MDRDGYGRFYETRRPRNVLAHRISWGMHRGLIPAGLHVLHKCDVPACVNPEHLFLGTHQDNIRDCVAKGRKVSPPVAAALRERTHCSHGHPYDGKNTYYEPAHPRWRVCRTCKLDRKHRKRKMALAV